MNDSLCSSDKCPHLCTHLLNKYVVHSRAQEPVKILTVSIQAALKEPTVFPPLVQSTVSTHRTVDGTVFQGQEEKNTSAEYSQIELGRQA